MNIMDEGRPDTISWIFPQLIAFPGEFMIAMCKPQPTEPLQP
jgi:hypothetical protein